MLCVLTVIVLRGMTLQKMLKRLVTARPMCTRPDTGHWLLNNGQTGAGGSNTIGTDNQREPLNLDSLLSPDEVVLAGLLSVSAGVHFVNDGAAGNQSSTAASSWCLGETRGRPGPHQQTGRDILRCCLSHRQYSSSTMPLYTLTITHSHPPLSLPLLLLLVVPISPSPCMRVSHSRCVLLLIACTSIW